MCNSHRQPGRCELPADQILNEVDLIACEDTRRTRILLQHYQIDKPTISYFQHNQRSREDLLLERLKRVTA